MDIESSKGIRDDGEGKELTPNSCIASLKRFSALEELNLFDTRLSDESLAHILLALSSLTHLIRGDFLCDALEWIDYWASF